MTQPQALTTYLELRQSNADGEESAGLSHKSEGLFLLHVLELASHGEPRGGVTLVHDAGDHGGRYLDAAQVLAEAQWAVALPDMRGHGKSEGERGHSSGLREVVRDLDAVQDHLAYRLPTAPKVLIGCGLGALYALRYTLEKPSSIAALVLLAPRWHPRFELPKPPSGLMKMFKKLEPSAAGRIGNDVEQLTSDAAAQQAWRSDALVHDAISLRAGTQALEIASECEARLREVTVPTLVLHGRDDRIADAALSERARGARVEVELIDGARHDLLHERCSKLVIERVRDWIGAQA